MAALADYRDLHRGETVLVCGCGRSLNELQHPERFTTIGVNDVGRLFTPTYLVAVNREDQFTPERFRWIRESRAKALFTCFDLDVPHPDVVRFGLGAFGGTDVDADDVLPHTKNSPYVAACLALFMGARRIGLIGVDFTADHFFARTGEHQLLTDVWSINREYRRLADAAGRRGVEILNLSAASRITSVPRASLADLARSAPAPTPVPPPAAAPATAPQPTGRPLRLVSYATTPIAGVPAVLARCVAHATDVDARCVWRCNAYGNGVSFDGDVQWLADPARARSALAEADVVVVHNGKVDPQHRALLGDKPVVTMAHNYMWNVDDAFVRAGSPGLVVGQYQATLPEFDGWGLVPNPVPTWEALFSPGPKGSEVTICYVPSGTHDVYPRDHRLWWHSKGHDQTMRALDRLARRRRVRLEVLRGRQVPHRTALAMKRRSHIVIDECVTGSYHRTSLEGLAAGCVVVNAIRSLPAVVEALGTCAGTPQVPFVHATLADLESVLEELVDLGPERLVAMGRTSRTWMEEHWRFEVQWERFWRPAIEAAFAARGNREVAVS